MMYPQFEANITDITAMVKAAASSFGGPHGQASLAAVVLANVVRDYWNTAAEEKPEIAAMAKALAAGTSPDPSWIDTVVFMPRGPLAKDLRGRDYLMMPQAGLRPFWAFFWEEAEDTLRRLEVQKYWMPLRASADVSQAGGHVIGESPLVERSDPLGR